MPSVDLFYADHHVGTRYKRNLINLFSSIHELLIKTGIQKQTL